MDICICMAEFTCYSPEMITTLLVNWLCAVLTPVVVSDSLWPHGSDASVHGDSPGKNTGVSCHALLQGIFPTQGLSSGIPHYRRILHHLSHQGSPRILECIACPFSRGSSRPRNQTGVSCVAGRFFTSWAARETLISYTPIQNKKFKINE